MADHIGQRIAARRRARRMTQADLAREAHVSLPMIKGCERGARTPGQSTLEAIAAALGVDASRLDPAYVGTGRRVHAALPAISPSPTPPGRLRRPGLAAEGRVGSHRPAVVGRRG